MSKPTLIVDDAEFELFKRVYIAVTVAPYKDANPYRAQVVTENIKHMFDTEMYNTNLFPLWCEARKLGIQQAYDQGYLDACATFSTAPAPVIELKPHTGDTGE